MSYPYHISPSAVRDITNQELNDGTQRLLPKPQQIPSEFWVGNAYTRLVEDIIVMNSLRGNSEEGKAARQRLTNTTFVIVPLNTEPEIHHCVIAHLKAINDPKVAYGHLVAGVALMLSRLIVINQGG